MAKSDEHLERALSRLVRKNWRGWQTFHEPGLGADNGIPDWETFVWGQCVHVELKVANYGKFGSALVKSEAVRPAQMSWHREAMETGVPCCFLFGVHLGADVWDLFAGEWLSGVDETWKSGMKIGEVVTTIGKVADIHQNFTKYAYERWGK